MTSTKNRIHQTATATMAYPFGLRTAIMELFDIGPAVAFTALAIASAIFLGAIVYFIRSAPPKAITISAGPEGSNFFKIAHKYAKILERNGVKAKVLTSNGSIENLQRLNDPKAQVDLGIVQTGPANEANDNLVSLGSISYQPLLVFYRGKHLDLLSQLEGKKISIGPVGSGTRDVALAVLGATNMKDSAKSTFLDYDAEDAQKGLKGKTIDAAFVMSESASSEIMKSLMHSGDIHLFNFIKHAPAYSRKFEYLNVLELPEGAISFADDIPSHDVSLLGPTVELIAPKTLHPALIDLIVEAATEVHAHPGMFQKRGEFPMAFEHSIHLSEEAALYYKSGKGYLYQKLPFWLASLLSRLFLVFVPVLVVLIPSLRAIPAFFRWMAQLRIRRRYRELRLLEQRFTNEKDETRRGLLREEFDRIDEGVNKMKVRASYADQFYGLRGHIDYVRRVVENERT
jgi:TRAP-type uncharacterized transport system substrate-binding protein